MYMSDYIKQLDSILTSSNRKLLIDAGTISHEQALEKARLEYRKYQENTLSPVEKEYIKNVRNIGKIAKNKMKE